MHPSRSSRLLSEIIRETAYTASETGISTLKSSVLDAIGSVRREKFVMQNDVDFAYRNVPFSIGYGQTITQPFIVALMTDALEIEPDNKVLEIGTGSGYQAAVLSLLAKEVYSVERIPELARTAATRLHRLGYRNVKVCCRNGYDGWWENAPFDRIIVTAAAPEIPPRLIQQLKPGGVMTIPVGDGIFGQDLTVIHKMDDGEIHSSNLLKVIFVPLLNSETLEIQTPD